MHELGIVDGILKVARESAQAAGATKVLGVTLRIGEMCEIVPEAMDFAWETLRDEDPMTAGAELHVEHVGSRSVCAQCGYEFDHDRYHCKCPKCGSGQTLTIRGREMDIVSIDVETPDD